MAALPKPYQRFKKEHARLWKAYQKLGLAAAEEGPLNEKTRELIKLGMSAAARSESAVHSHAIRSLEAGATTAEVEHAIVIGVTTLGFPAMMMALGWVHAAVASYERTRM